VCTIQKMFDRLLDEDLLLQLGNVTKGNVTRFLRKNFQKDVDYTIKQLSCEGKWGGQNKLQFFMTEETYELLCNSYNLKNKCVEKINDTNIRCVMLGVEHSTVSFICNCLKSTKLTLQRQFKISKYYVDLYIPELSLCIECDEFGHQHYSKHEELERETFITDQLKCEFLRYNPNEDKFKLSNLIDIILQRYIALFVDM